MHSLFIHLQTPDGGAESLIEQISSMGSIPVILLIATVFVLLLVYINYRLKIIQRDLHRLGMQYYEKEKIILDDLKAGRITRDTYRKKHASLVSEMRQDSRRMTDGPPV